VGRLLILAIPLAITVYAFIDVLSTPGSTFRRGPKLLWAIAVLLLPLVGAVLWFVLGRPRRRRDLPRSSAPDDDAEFLRELQWRARQQRKPESDEPTPDDPSI
jgi:hypothetical protein